MRSSRRIAVLLLLSASPAFAQEPIAGPEPAMAGTADGAKALVDGLAPYFGRGAFDNGTLKVEPDPAGYRLTIDPKPLADAMKSSGGEFTMAPYSILVSRRDDGTWNYFSDALLDVTLRSVTTGVEQVIDYDLGKQRTKGVYSPALAAFLSGTGTIDGASMTMKQPDSDVTARFGAMRFDITGKPAADNTVDMTMRQSAKDFAETISTKEGPDTLPGGLKLDIKAAGYDGAFNLSGARSRSIVDLYSFFVAHPEYLAPSPDKAKLAAAQSDLKTRLGAAMPLWSAMDGAYTLSGIEIGSQMGRMNADRMNVAIRTTGVTQAASLSYALGFAGLEVASPALPDWTASLLPREMDLRFKVDGVDVKTPADIALADFDLARAEPISVDAQKRIGESFTANPPRFVIEPSRIVARDYDLAMSGSVIVQNDRPALTMDISAGGIDKAIATLQSAAQTMPDVNQAVGALAMAKGFGKSLPDGRTQWVVDASSDGSVKINGFQVKAPDPATAPDAGDMDDPGGDEGIAPDGEVPMDQAPTDDNALPDSPPK